MRVWNGSFTWKKHTFWFVGKFWRVLIRKFFISVTTLPPAHFYLLWFDSVWLFKKKEALLHVTVVIWKWIVENHHSISWTFCEVFKGMMLWNFWLKFKSGCSVIIKCWRQKQEIIFFSWSSQKRMSWRKWFWGYYTQDNFRKSSK